MSNHYRDVKTTASVADAYRSMYAKVNEDVLNEELIDSLIEDVRDEEINEWIDYLEETKTVFSVPKQNVKKVRYALTKLSKRHPKVKVTFGTHSKGKFVDDNNINFDGKHDDIDNLMKAIQKDKALLKMMESSELEEGALADKAKKSGISVDTLRKVYNRGMAAWKSGHRPGTTPQQWGHARVNAFIVKKKKGGLNHDKDLAHVVHPDDSMLDEVKKQEVDAMKKVSKDMQSVLKSYQKIANMGDKELKNTIHNKDYKKVLDARDTILKMIGTLNTKMLMQKENFELVEASAGEMIDKLFNAGGDRMMTQGIAKLLNMTDVKVALAMQKQNPTGFKSTMIAMGKDSKTKLAPQGKDAYLKRLKKMFKKAGIKPIPEGLEEKVKDGKVDPLSKMGKSKLTGSEINQYYRDNPKQKAAARDKTVKKAIELALDLSGATNYAIKEIEKLKRGLSRLPAVKLALQHANESKEFTGHHVIIENLSSTDLIKLKTYGKMLAKMTKLQFDDSKPEQSIDKLMGQIWKQKHVPANWERLHKMVALLNKIGVKMPSLKGKYMGLDPVSKKAIFYKEGTDEIVDWNKDISEIKEGIEEIVEAQEMKDTDVKKIAQMTDRNDHNGSLMHLAKVMGDRKSLDALKGIMQTHKALGHMPKGLIDTRMAIFDDLMKQSKKKYRNHNDIYSAL